MILGADTAKSPCVLIHGAMRTGRWEWWQVATRLAKSRKVLVPDLPGHGRDAQRPARDFDEQLDRLISVVGKSKRPVHLIGHSNGGSLVLAALPHLSAQVLSAVVQGANASVSTGLREALAQFTVNDVHASPELLNRYRRVHTNWESLFEASRTWALGGPNLSGHDLRQIGTPVLVVEGSDDPLNAELGHGSEIARDLPNAEHWQPTASHDVHHELPDEWGRMVEEFISRHDQPAVAESTFATVATVSMRAEPDSAGVQVSQLLPGEVVTKVEESGSWAKVRHIGDGYVGWVDAKLASCSTLGLEEGWHVIEPFIGRATDNGLVSMPVGTPLVPSEQEEWWELRTGQRIQVSTANVAPPEHDAWPTTLEAIRRLLGTPYQWGGRTERGIDCSALSQLSGRLRGMILPRDSWEQYEATPPAAGDRRSGDLVFFADPGTNPAARVSHVAVHIGDNRIIHAYGPAEQVVLDDIDDLLSRDRSPILVGWSRPQP